MATQKITLKLTRFAKVAERIQIELKTRELKITSALSNQNAPCFGFEIPASRAAKDAEKALSEGMREYRLLAEAYSAIRKELARANVRYGVSDVLADFNRLMKYADIYKRLAAPRQVLDIDEATQYIEKRNAIDPGKGADRYGIRSADEFIDYIPFRRERIAEFEAESIRLRREIDAISDELSTLNGNPVTVELDAEVVDIMKLQ